MTVPMLDTAVVFPASYDGTRVALFMQGLQITLSSLAFILYPVQILRFLESTLLAIQHYTGVVSCRQPNADTEVLADD